MATGTHVLKHSPTWIGTPAGALRLRPNKTCYAESRDKTSGV